MSTATRSAPRFELLSAASQSLLIRLREAVAPILDNNLLKHFTDHSVSHADHVCEIIDTLIAPAKDTPERLNENELVAVYSAAYLHDVGMHYEKAGFTNSILSLNLGQRWEELSEATRNELIRTHHPAISAELVQLSGTADPPPLGIRLTPDFFPNEVACLCEAHTLPTNSNRYAELTKPAPKIRMKLLAAILRLADILDESRRRACRAKAETLLLDLESQSHWWRHYYTRDVEFNPSTRELTVWFEFPTTSKQIYREIIPQLQMPHIYREITSHQSALNQAGLIWTVNQRISDPEYNTIDVMPPDVLTHMLKFVTRLREREREDARQIALQSFKSTRPSVNQRLQELQEKKDLMSPDQYLEQLAEVAFDLWELGSRRSAWMALYSAYPKFCASLAQDKRIKLGVRLLEMLLEDGKPDMAQSWIGSFHEDCEKLPLSDPLRARGQRTVAEWCYQMGETDHAQSLFQALLTAEEDEEQRDMMSARITEMQLLLGSPVGDETD